MALELILEDPQMIVTVVSALFVLGGFGQLVRGAIGILKSYKEATANDIKFSFDYKELALSVVVGGLIGVFAGVLLDSVSPIAIIPIGYAGEDALEGILKNR